MVRGDHWTVDRSEVETWSAEAVELLDRIPASTVDRLLHASTIVTVAVGVGGIVVPRLMMENAMRAMRQQAEQAAAERADADGEEHAAYHDADTETETPSSEGTTANPFTLIREGF